MPSKHPRMALTLTPELHKALKDLSEATGTSAAAFVVEILTSTLPSIKSVTQAALMARSNPPKALAAFSELMLQAHADVTQNQLDFLESGRKLRAVRKPRKKQVNNT
jgi:hypothetical protein